MEIRIIKILLYFEYTPYNYIVITIPYKGCVSIFWRNLLPACHCIYVQSKRYYYYLQPHDNVAMQLINKTN